MKPATKTLVIPEPLHRRFKIETAKRGIPIGKAVEAAIVAWLSSAKKGGKS